MIPRPPSSPLFPYTTLFRSERGAAQHRHDLIVDRAKPQALLDLLDRKLVGLEVLVHQLFVRFGRGFDHLLVPLLRLGDRKSTRLNSSHVSISYAVFCLKKKT